MALSTSRDVTAQRDNVAMDEKIDLTGDPDTGRWTAKYRGKTHRYPKVARPKDGEEAPKEVVEWAGQLIAQRLTEEALGKHFR